jgi:tetratricopeptide (TPR) repeat protein
MFYWTLFIVSGLGLGAIFLRRVNLTRKGLVFETEMKKKAKREGEETDQPLNALEDSPSDLQVKRHAEQKARDEKNRCIREGKKAFKQADLHFSKGDYGLAEKHLLNVLSYDNDHLNANLKLGLLYLHQENLPRAEFFFQKLLDLKESPIYYSNLALTLYQQNRLEEAAKLYERAIELDNKKATRFVSLAHVYNELGEMERALGHFEEALRLDPRNLDYLWSLFEYYEKFTRLEKMALIMKRILELDPYNDTAKAKLILIQEELEEETPVIETKNDEKEA